MSRQPMSKLPRQAIEAEDPTVALEQVHPAKPLSSADAELSTVFEQLAQRLSEQHQVNRGVMVVCDDSSRELGVVSVWDERGMKEGLTLTLPSEDSLFHQVVKDGRQYVQQKLSKFSGNFFERKLLLEAATSSMVLMPLTSKEQVVGLVGFSSVANGSIQEIVGEEFLATTSVLAGLIESKIY